MFRKLYNHALIEGILRPEGPILIASGRANLDPVAADLAFVRTRHRGISTVYLPGSSIKGAMRAHGERLLTTWIGEHAAEDPFQKQASNRHQAAKKREAGETHAVYRLSCAADRLFGSTEIAGRFRVADAHPTQNEDTSTAQTEIRYGVAINRARQSVEVGPFEMEAVTSVTFRFRAQLENFELWMLSLVLQILIDLKDGWVQLGHGKSRGFGSVDLQQPEISLRWPGQNPSRLAGAGAMEPREELRDALGLIEDDAIDFPAEGESQSAGLFSGYRYRGWDQMKVLQDALAEDPWQRFIERARRGNDHGA